MPRSNTNIQRQLENDDPLSDEEDSDLSYDAETNTETNKYNYIPNHHNHNQKRKIRTEKDLRDSDHVEANPVLTQSIEPIEVEQQHQHSLQNQCPQQELPFQFKPELLAAKLTEKMASTSHGFPLFSAIDRLSQQNTNLSSRRPDQAYRFNKGSIFST